MPGKRIVIRNIRLRIPGKSREEGERLARTISRELTTLLHNGNPVSTRTIETLNVRISSRPGQGSLAKTIAENIARRIG